jgi:tRNA A-37 threonylcarbamoyl transferase component Bud32
MSTSEAAHVDETGVPRAAAVELLERMGLISASEVVSAEPLPGGVSSDIWLVRTAERALVLKRPRQRLKVEADWQAPLDRGASEAAWLDYVSSAVPGACPRVLGYDSESFAIALEYLDPERHRNWKTEMLAGRIEPAFAAKVGRDLGLIHSASARAPELAFEFDHADLFESLRIEPYLVRTAALVPEATGALEAVIADLRATRIALVHGDVSPKNILVGERPIFLDAECATWSDPAFDAAFCLTHLTLKRIHSPAHAAELEQSANAFTTAYLAEVDWEEPSGAADRLARIVPALMLARVAGASPVEYLNESAREIVRRVAIDALLSGAPVDALIRQAEGATRG